MNLAAYIIEAYLVIGLTVWLIGVGGHMKHFKCWKSQPRVILIWSLRLIKPRLYWRLLMA
jgi:hypothetical protein